MWDGEFVVSVPRDFVRDFHTPILVLPGTDRCHPIAAGGGIASLAPNDELFDPWKSSRLHAREAAAAVGRFLEDHLAPGES